MPLPTIDELNSPTSSPSPKAPKRLPSIDELNASPLPSIDDLNSTPSHSAEPREGYKVTDAEVEDIAKKHGVNAKFLRDAAPYFGGSVDTGKGDRDAGEVAKRVAGEVSENTLLNVPQFLYKKAHSPDEQRALDDLVGRMKDREMLADLGIDAAASLPGMALGFGAAGAAAKGAGLGAKAVKAAQLGEVAAQGAIQGVATSKSGEELKGAAVGAGIGLATGVAFHAAGAVVGKGLDRAKQGIIAKWTEREDSAQLLTKVEEFRAPLKEVEDQTAKAIIRKEPIVPNYAESAAHIPEAFTAELAEQGVPSETIVSLYNQRKLDGQTMEFAQHLQESSGKKYKTMTLQDSQKLIDTKVATEGEDFVTRQFNNYRNVKASYAVMRDRIVSGDSPKGSFLERAVFFFSDNRPVAGIIDTRNGTNLQVVLDKGSQSNDLYTLHMDYLAKDTVSLAKQMKAEGVNATKVIAAMRAQSLDGLSESETKAAHTLNALFEKSRLEARELGVPIERLRGADGKEATFYVPDHIMDPADAIVAMRAKIEEASKSLGVNLLDLTKEEYPAVIKALNKEHPELLQGIRTLTSMDDVSSSLAQFTGALKASQNAGKASQLMDISASAAFRREGNVPEFLKETDALKLLNNWQRDTFRYAYFREPLEELRTLNQHFVNAGDTNAARLTANGLLDLTGRQRGTLGNYVRDKLTSISVEAKDSLRKGEGGALTQMLARAPDYYTSLTNQVYPNFLAWNPRSIMTNATQPMMMVTPELGPVYGPKVLFNAYLEAAQTLASGEKIKLSSTMARTLGKKEGEEITTSNLSLVLKNKGMMGANYNQELIQHLSQGIKESSAVGKLASDANHFMNEVGMAGFAGAETLNRYTTDRAARRVAKDFLNGDADAARFFKASMNEGYQREVMMAMKRGDVAEVENLFANHLIAKTAFHYDRWTMSEFGRFMGPGLSAFTKWPTVIAGDIASQFYTKDLKGAAGNIGRRYVAPLVLVNVASSILASEEVTKSPIYQSAFGKEGLAKASPLSSLKDVVEGKVAKPPLVSAATDLTTAGLDVLKGDPQKLWKWANNTVYSYTPQAGFIRFVTEEVPHLISGERPKGTFTGKIQQALTGENSLDELFKKDK